MGTSRSRSCPSCGVELMRGEVGCCLGCAVKLILELGNDSDEVAAFYGDAARLAEVLGA